MTEHFLKRLSVALLVVGMASACAPSELQEFAVTGAQPAAPGTLFRNSDPNINDVQARGYCADGYDKLSQQTQPTDSGPIDEWRVRCKPYTVSFMPF